MSGQDLRGWLSLALIPEIGPRRGKRLLEKFKTPRAVLGASLGELAKVEKIGWETAKGIVEARQRLDLSRQLKLIEKNKVTLLPLDSPRYPAILKFIFDPPLVLFVKGEILAQDYFSIAIVGTRMSSFYGRGMAEKLSGELSQRGFTIVSGGARGIDTASHKASLKAGGRTLAVLGCGLDTAYPSENKKLFAQISEAGALVSEFPLGTMPARENFPMRNRLISGLSLGVVVIEAPQKSGALITVTHANEQGREVFSVPGKADSFLSKGSNQLLREGAKLVENADDIIEELEPILKSKLAELKSGHRQAAQEEQASKRRGLSGEEARLYGLICAAPAGLDLLAEKTDMDIPKISAILLKLQLARLIKELPGKQFEAVYG